MASRVTEGISMINPGVVTLASLNGFEYVNFPYRFCIEDNIGESIHIHYKDIRLDLTVEEFSALAEKAAGLIEKCIDVPGFSVKRIGSTSLVNLAALLPYLTKVRIEKIHLEDILVDTFDEHGRPMTAPLPNSRVLKALHGDTAENDRHYVQFNFFKNGSCERLKNHERIYYNLNQIKEHGYPYGDELIGLWANHVIFDGQHRAACLYYLYGNIEVPVQIFEFSNTGGPEIITPPPFEEPKQEPEKMQDAGPLIEQAKPEETPVSQDKPDHRSEPEPKHHRHNALVRAGRKFGRLIGICKHKER